MPIEVTVYGAEMKCASCVHLPSAKETQEWLEAAVTRKFPNISISFIYCDITSPQTEEQRQFSKKILDEEFLYPLVVINSDPIAEGNPRLKKIFEKIESLIH
nr:YuzD family protein [Texcoconibacillus texcoconensis]